MKKVIATSLIAGILGMNFVPLSAFAAQEIKQAEIIKEEKKLSKKEKKALEEKQNKINYVNIEWWEGYNDPILTDYIFKALANNQDLKIATLKVEEARQATKLQLDTLDLTSSLFCEVNPIPVKAAMNMIGFNAGTPRLPLIEMSETGKERLKNSLIPIK